MMGKTKIVVIVGPTASGKSQLAMDLADHFDGEIISADSMQVYKYMDIGTAKPTVEERRHINHHMIDIVEPDMDFNVGSYVRDARKIIERLFRCNKKIFVVGGTGLYVKALVRGLFKTHGKNSTIRNQLENEIECYGLSALYGKLRVVDNAAAARIHPHDRVRIVRALEVFYQTNQLISDLQKQHGFRENPYDSLLIGISHSRNELYKRIEERVDGMIRNDLIGEVETLLKWNYGPELKSMQSLGYKEITQHILGNVSLKDAISLLKRNTRRYAKRQLTWFNKDGQVNWLTDKNSMIERIETFL
jgi:tRNA dimethylallyltransferase